MTLLFISHPEVRIDPERPVPLWGLSERGAARMRAFASTAVTAGVSEIWSSAETKAVEAAHILAEARDLDVNIEPDLHENDRSATGFLPPPEFEAVVSQFFAEPGQSVRGWETALAAQARIRAAVERILQTRRTGGDLAIVGHGGVGTLLLSHYLGVPISRAYDQPSQGHYWRFDPGAGKVEHPWRAL